jgi:type II secretory ATPase GspE/PulE/Tfp pilus assembly ATPase PilB-like protein
LARKICTFCKTEYTLSDEERKIFEEYGVPAEKGYRGSGCEKCGGKGYAGRVVFAEVFVVDDEIKDLIFNNVPMSQLRSTAMKKGMCLIKTDGLIKAAQGITTIDEVIRVSG